MTNRAMDFMTDAEKNDRPWVCHLSYIKPRWPYIVRPPYHDMFNKTHIVPPFRSLAEQDTPHPLMQAYLGARVCKSFARDHVREHVIPAYMGLIKQLDDNLGRLFTWMDAEGHSEHDYHWSKMALRLKQPQESAHTKMIFDGRWKYIRCEGFDPVMFDLETHPDELVDFERSQAAAHIDVRARLEAALLTWAARHHTPTTSNPKVLARQNKAAETGILIGFWDDSEYLETVGKAFDMLTPVGRG